MGKLDM